MTDKNFIQFSWLFGSKTGQELTVSSEISKALKSKDLAWVHMYASDPKAEEWIRKEIKYLDPIIIEALVADETRPRFLQYKEGLLLILRGVNLNKGDDPEDMVSLRVWIDEHRIISLERRCVRAIRDIETSLQEGKGPKNAGDFLVLLINNLLERMEPAVMLLDEMIDNIEEEVIDSPSISNRQAIMDIRKKAILFRRYIYPQREAIRKVYTADIDFLTPNHKLNINEASDKLLRYIEELDAIRERAQIIKDEISNILSDKQNKNLYILSVIAAIFLPLGFLTGLLGINVAGIPGSENINAFTIFCGFLGVIVFAQVLLFKWFKWF